MSFLKKLWQNRQSEHPSRRILTNVNTNDVMLVEVARSEGEVLAEGDAFDESNMNDLEERIESAFNEEQTNIDSINNSVGKVENQLNGFYFGVTSDGKAGYRRGASTEITPFKTSTSLSVHPEGGKRWCRLTVTVNSGTITYGGKIYTAGQSIVIEARNPSTTQEDVPADAGWHGMIASS